MLTSVRVGMRSPLASTAASVVAPLRCALSRISTPRFMRRPCAYSASDFGSSGRMSLWACRRMTRISPPLMFRKARAADRTKSFSSATASTPENPPPATTKVSSPRRAAGSGSMSASSSVWMMRFLSASASPKSLNGSACSASPRWPAKLVTVPSAMMRWSYSRAHMREPKRTRVEVRARAEPPDRRDRVDDADAAGDYLWEHRLEDHVVVAVDEPELDAAASQFTPEELLERQRRVDAAEAAAKDEDSNGPVSHAAPPNS